MIYFREGSKGVKVAGSLIGGKGEEKGQQDLFLSLSFYLPASEKPFSSILSSKGWTIKDNNYGVPATDLRLPVFRPAEGKKGGEKEKKKGREEREREREERKTQGWITMFL